MFGTLSDHISKYVKLTGQEQDELFKHLRFLQVRRRHKLQEAGKKAYGSWFIVKGCVRQYLVNEKLEEKTINFAIENWWISDREALFFNQLSRTTIQTIEDAELIYLSDEARTELFTISQKFESYFRIMAERAWLASQRRLELMFNMSEEEIYLNFEKNFPDFIQRVPQYMLASYLGFTPQFMSRIKARKFRR